MPKFRKKPVVIEAVHFISLPESVLRLLDHEDSGCMFMEYPILQDSKGIFLEIPTDEGVMRANLGDWIVTGIKGERYPCKPDIFEATYELVEAT